ncbi:MAG: hypothetical protein PHD55_09340 [Methanoregula sp.]|nr:hypothetical protein [Methanoregula sp.]
MAGILDGNGHAGKKKSLLFPAGKFLLFQLAGIGYCSFLPKMLRYAGPTATGLLTLGFIIVWAFFSEKSLTGICGYFRHAAAGCGTGH